MTDDMNKRRDECFQKELQKAKNCCETCYYSFLNSEINYNRGFDAGFAEMQAQVDELKQSKKYWASRKCPECSTWLVDGDELSKIAEENRTIKQALDVAVKALKIVSFLKGKVHWVAPNNRDELRTLLENGEQSLTSINEIINKTKQGE